MAGAFSLFTTVLMMVLPIYVFQIFERVLTSRSIPTLTMLMLITAGAMVVLALLDLVRRVVLRRAGAVLEHRLTGPIAEILFDANRHGPRPGLRQTLADVATLRDALCGPAQRAVTELPWLVLFLILVLLFHPAVLLVAAIVTLLLVAVAVLARPLTIRRARDAQTHAILADTELEERLRHAPTLAAMGMTPMIIRRWRTTYDTAQRELLTIHHRLALLDITATLLRHLGTMGVLGMAAWLFIESDLTAAGVITVGLLADRAFGVLTALVAGWPAFVHTRGARDRLRALFEQAKPPAERMTLPPPTGAVAVQQVMVAPPGARHVVLKGVSLELAAGGSLGIIGPSGAGKTALARTLVGLWSPAQGTVRLDGNDLANWNADQLGHHVGYLSQDIALTNGTVAETIARMGPVDPEGVIEAARRAHVHEVLLRLPNGYDTDIGENGHVLPAGLRQRVALARALYGDPRLIVLDEPNAFQDTEGEQALTKALQTMREDGRTVVMITQKPTLLTALDSVLVLREGQIEMMGPRDSVLSRFARGAGSAQGRGRIAPPKDSPPGDGPNR